jgi:thiosulfate/3-mercaptopyruvate sulfurtransferase
MCRRFTGSAPEPRPGLSSGHIPNSFSLPFTTFLQKRRSTVDGSEYTTFLPEDALRSTLEATIGHEQAGLLIEGKKPAVTTCGSGMTAGVLWLGLSLLGVKNPALYDEVHLLNPGIMATTNINDHSRGRDMLRDQKAGLSEFKQSH